MKKYLISIGLAVLIVLPQMTSAVLSDIDPDNMVSKCISLSNNLRYRLRDTNTNGEVSLLQDFLQSQNYFNQEPTGFFGILTLKAVKDFQRDNNISPTGYVGPITRTKINTVCGQQSDNTSPVSRDSVQTNINDVSVLRAPPVTTSSVSSPSFISVHSPNGGESLPFNSANIITWTSSSNVRGVDIALYKNDVYVDLIAIDLPNSGSYTWTPSNVISTNDTGTNMFKIYIMGTKATGTNVEDYSNGSFSIVAPQNYSLLGDANFDGLVNNGDILIIQLHVKNNPKLTGQAFINADVDGDGYVLATDWSLISQYKYGGFITKLPKEEGKTVYLGDANLDGFVSIGDTLVIQLSVENKSSLYGIAFSNADVDGDGKLTNNDSVLIGRYYGREIQSFPRSGAIAPRFVTTPPTTPPSSISLLLGDVNFDGLVNIGDVLPIEFHVKNNPKLTGQAFINADVNKDGLVNHRDSLLVADYDAGLLKEFPVEPVPQVSSTSGYRYLKIQSSSNSWVAWDEIQAYDSAGTLLTPVDCSVSSRYTYTFCQGVYVGDVNSWSAGTYSGYIILDFGSNKNISKVKLLPSNNNNPNPATATNEILLKVDGASDFTSWKVINDPVYNTEWMTYPSVVSQSNTFQLANILDSLWWILDSLSFH